jgi:hypothetical protein
MSLNFGGDNWQNQPEGFPPNLPGPRHPQPGEPGRYGGMPNLGRASTWITAAIGAKAAANWYHMNGDAKEAAEKGVESFVHWTIWSGIVFAWWLTFAIGGLNGQTEVFESLFRILLGCFVIGVSWCRNIDRSLFRRGILYKVYGRLAKAVEAVPTPLIYGLALLFLVV